MGILFFEFATTDFLASSYNQFRANGAVTCREKEIVTDLNP